MNINPFLKQDGLKLINYALNKRIMKRDYLHECFSRAFRFLKPNCVDLNTHCRTFVKCYFKEGNGEMG